jgi:hydrophobe/amphiphile efflux-1 (HAE1) family protein
MKIWQICIERPVLASVLSIVVVLFGVVALTRLQNREFPDIDPPIVAVTTVLRGAAPEVVETSVTQPLEDQLIGIAGVRHLTSVSYEEVSLVTVEFDLGRDVDLAANEVRDRVARAMPNLPDDVEQPVVAKNDADASPIMWIALHGEGWDPIRISTFAETQVQDRLSKLPGVSDVWIAGERRQAMRVWVDNRSLTVHGLTVSDVVDALRRENVDIPSGRVEGEDSEFALRTLGELKTPEGFGNIIVADVEAGPIRLRDVARVEVGAETERKLVRFNMEPAVGLGIIKQSKANTLDVSDAVSAEVERIRPTLPPGLHMEKAFDSSVFIRRSLDDVQQTIFEAVVLVVIVIYLFLRSFRATIVPALAIPVSLFGTFAVLYFLDFSVNTLTLMGLTLAIGLVVDDAIVVLENVTRLREEGAEPMEAARRGMDQIAFAVIAATLSAMAVFLPLAFLTDTTGRLFREFGITVAAAVGISGFVALTLSPMLCARVLKPGGREGRLKHALHAALDGMTTGYARLLRPALAHRGIVLLLGGAWVALGVVLLGFLGREFIPTADRGAVVTMTRAPEGSTIDYTARYQREAEAMVDAIPEVSRSFSVVALGIGAPGRVSEGAMFTSLVPWEERERSQQELVEQLRGEMSRITGIQAFPINLPALPTGVGSMPVQMVVQGPTVLELARYVDDIVARGREIPGLVNLQHDLVVNKPELEVEIDRDRASRLGVSVRDLATTLQAMVGGFEASTYKLGGETYDVIVRLDAPQRETARQLYQLNVRGQDEQLISMASVARLKEAVTPQGLPHYDRRRSATVKGSLMPGTPLGETLTKLHAIALGVLPDDGTYAVTFSGESESFYESSNALVFAYVLAVVIVYLVLAAQFESFLHPVTILIAVALSFTGALVTLLLMGHTLNLFSEIGLVMLVGLITKNSILIVEFAEQLREEGHELVEATLQASVTRFRPILMTAVSTIVGIVPIALGLGAGGEARAPLGMAVVGGMFFSTILTFFVVPAAYVALTRLVERRSRAAAASGDRRAAAA